MSHRSSTSVRLAAAREQAGRHREQLMTLMFWALALIALVAALLAQTDAPTDPAPAVSAVSAPAPATAGQPGPQAPRPQAQPPAPQPAQQSAQQSTQRTYQVRPGDTLASIALRHGVDYQRIAADNRLVDPNRIRPGQTLSIGQPTPGVQLIRPGDTLAGLSTATGSTVRELRALNPWITNPNRIPAGAGLRVRR